MKKTLILSALCFSLTFAIGANAGGADMLIPPDYFSGFYVGGTGAFHMAAFNGSSSTDTPTEVAFTENFTILEEPLTNVSVNQTFFQAGNLISGNVNSNAFDGYFGVHGGVGKVFDHRWYTGFEGFGEWGSQNPSVTNNANFNNVSQLTLTTNSGTAVSASVPVSGNFQTATSVKLTNDYGVVFRPGFLVAPQTLVYGKVGAIWANLRVSNSVTGTSNSSLNDSTSAAAYQAKAALSGSSSNKDTKIALLLGLGLEQFIYKNFITLGVEYNYANYGHVSTITAVNADEAVSGSVPLGEGSANFSDGSRVYNVGTTQACVNARVSTLLGSLNFYFGSHWF